MSDVLTPEQRHKCMSNIRGKDTNPEIIVRKYLFSRGYRYRKNVKNLPGTPDVVLKRYNTIIFVHGCFWHGHDCGRYSLPKNKYWIEKIYKNKDRDEKNYIQLRILRWHVIIIWECQLRKSIRRQTLESLDITLNRIFLDKVSVKQNIYAETENNIGQVAEPIEY